MLQVDDISLQLSPIKKNGSNIFSKHSSLNISRAKEQNVQFQEYLERVKDKAEFKYKYSLFKNNAVNAQLNLNYDLKRERLPFLRNFFEKINVWGIIKDLVGKDMTRFAVPVTLNEPLSMLQKFAE